MTHSINPIDIFNPVAYHEGRERPHFRSRYRAERYAEEGKEVVTLRQFPGEKPYYLVMPIEVWFTNRKATDDPYLEGRARHDR